MPAASLFLPKVLVKAPIANKGTAKVAADNSDAQTLPGFLQTLFGGLPEGLGATLAPDETETPSTTKLTPQAQRDMLLAMHNPQLQVASASLPSVPPIHVPTGAPAAVAQGLPVAAVVPGKPIPSGGDDKAALSQMIESQRPDLGWEGNAMRSLLRPGFTRDLFDNYWQGGGQAVQLSGPRFKDIADYAATLKPLGTRQVTGQNGQALEARSYSLYGSPDYARSLGRSTLFYDQAGNPVGFRDDYNFDPSTPQHPRSRDWKAEAETRIMSVLGARHGARGFPVYYGEYGAPIQ